MDLTAHGRGQARWAGDQASHDHDHSFVLRAKAISKRSFSSSLGVQCNSRVCISFIISSTGKRQARRKPSTLAIRCGGQARVESTTKTPHQLPLYSSSSQIHADSSSTAHTSSRSRPELAAVFPNHTPLFPIRSQQTACDCLQHACVIDDMAKSMAILHNGLVCPEIEVRASCNVCKFHSGYGLRHLESTPNHRRE